MRRSVLILATFIFGTCSFAQTTVSFDCYTDGPLPLDGTGTCEGVASNGLGGFGGSTGVTSTGNCSFPTLGTKYCRLTANGPVTVPNGGPFPWPVPFATPPAEVRVPIPVGSTTISFDWEYFNAESFGSSFNDGMAVAVLTSTGALVQQLAYADNQVPVGSCTDFTSFATEIQPNGFQNFTGPLPPLAGCEYLSIVCWNDGDNAVSGVAFIDNIVFNSALASCGVPCFGGFPALVFSAPSGTGCLQVNLGGLPGNGTYFLAVSLTAGAFPNGWFNGIDIGFADLISQVNFGFPFSGPTSSCGSSQVGEFCGLPSGLGLYAVALGIPGPVLGPWTAVTPAASFVIP
jgi:hypothetical protein